MKLVVALAIFLAVQVSALDLTKPMTLYYNWEAYCRRHPGSADSTIDVAPNPNGKGLTFTPTNWLNETTFTCTPTTFDESKVSSNDFLALLLGKSLSPMIKDKDQVNFYNCTYEEEYSELVFLINGQNIMTLNFIEDDCQIAFSPAAFYDFTAVDFQGVAENPNKCSHINFEGNVHFYNFSGLQRPFGSMSQLKDEIEGSLTIRADNMGGSLIIGDASSTKMQCAFQSFGSFYALSCPNDHFYMNNAFFGVFLLDNGDSYIFLQGDEDEDGLPCLQYIKSGQVILFSLVLFLTQALFVFVY